MVMFWPRQMKVATNASREFMPECHSAIDDCLSSCTLFLEKELEKKFSNVMIEKIKMFECLTPSSKSYLDKDKILILAREYKESHKIDCTLLKHKVFRCLKRWTHWLEVFAKSFHSLSNFQLDAFDNSHGRKNFLNCQ